MKRFLALFLALVMIFGMVPALGTTAKAETVAPTADVTAKPFYGLAWDTVERSIFGNLEKAPVMTVSNTDGVVSTSGSGDYAAYAATMKTTLDALPEGMRYIRIFKTAEALRAGAECVVYADNGMNQLKALMTEFIEEYYAIGGQLDGIILDTEYTAMGSWYIYSDTYGGYYTPSDDKIAANGLNRNIYNDIVNHPQYATDIRPLLEERGFAFYDNVGGNKSEIWSMFPPQIWGNFSSDERTKFNTYYTNCYSIWNRVMNNRIATYLTDAVYNPMAARYPNATVSDYTVADSATWEHSMAEGASLGYYYGNTIKVGNTSNENMYNSGPNSAFFKDGDTYLYNNIQSHNEAVYDDDAYGSLMFNVNRFKSMYAATDTKKISAWIAEYDYSGRDSSVKNSPYYTEFLYHMGLLDPLPFLIYMYTGASKFTGTEGKVKYNECMKVISQALNELTRVAGYSDRKPIELPVSWNDGFMLSGMYANARNIWRLTPDTTDGKTLADFKVADTDPTFSINGNTITFPGGKIITDSTIDVVGSCGYWIETAKDVQPVITREADRYAKNPSYLEDFTYTDGTVFNSENAKDVQAWEASSDLLIEGGALALTGTATLGNVKLPKNITAGDAYAKQQAWELSFTLSDALTSGNVTLFNGAVKLEGNKAYYNANGTYTALADLTAGTKYTINVNNNFAANTATYTLSANGVAVATAKDVTVAAVTLPVETITMAATGVSTKVLIDDYKLYPTGLEHTIKFYDGNVGVIQSATEQLTNAKVAFRLSWMNATSEETKGQIRVARYNSEGTLVSDTVLRTIDMKPYWDGVETGVLENTTGKLTVYLHICEKSNTELQNQKDVTCAIDGYTGDLVCKTCGEIYEKGSVIKANGHKKVTIPGKAATCTTDGLTRGEQCSVCGEILLAQETIPAAHKEQIIPGVAATCTTPGKTEGKRCTTCGETLVAQEVIPALGHTENTVKENVVAGSCTEAGSYDLIVSCTTCGEELSREHITEEAVGHTEEIIPGKAATCTEDGLTEGKKCSVCGEILVAQTTISATDHDAAEPVKENETATSYDLVVRCANCNEILASETVNFVSGTVTLFGTAVTIDTDVYSEEEEALYWVNGAEGEAPAAAAATDNWNYSFTLVNGVPTVTIKNASYSYAATFLSATYDGVLDVVYEGTNNINVPYKASGGYAFVSYASATNSVGKGKLNIKGAEDAILNVTGGSKGVTMLAVSKKAYLTISGGTVYMERTNAGGVNGVIGAAYSKTTIENCTLTVKSNDGVGGKHPAFSAGYSSYGMTINNANVTIESNAHASLCLGVFQSNMKGVLYPAALTITGNSNVKVINESNATSDYAYNGVGIYASNVTVKGGNLEVEGKKQAVYTTSGNAPILTSYVGEYNMYTTKDGEAVTEYTATTYFKVSCKHVEETLSGKAATCTEPGLTDGKKCSVCGLVLTEQTEIPALGHTEQIIPGYAATCTTTGMSEGKGCSVCGEILVEQEILAANGHSYDDDFDADCNVCGEAREVEATVIVTADNTLELVDGSEKHIHHRVTVYFLGDQNVDDITDEATLQALDPAAKTYWGAEQINTKVLNETGNYVLALSYNDNEQGGKKQSVYVAASVTVPELILPQINIEDHKIVATAGSESIVNYRAVVYYLGNRTIADVNNTVILKAMDPAAKTYWGLSEINKVQLWESGNYVIHLQFNVGKGVKQFVAKAFTNEFSEMTINVINGKLVAADPNNAYVYHRAVVYYVGDELVNPDNIDEVKAAAITTTTYWGLDSINNARLKKTGNYVVVLEYNLPNSPKMSIAIDAYI